MGLFDFIFIHVFWKDLKKAFIASGIEMSPNYKLTEDDLILVASIFSNFDLMYKYGIMAKHGKEILGLIMYYKGDYIGLDAKAFSYKLTVYHREEILQGYDEDNEYDRDMRNLKKIFGY